MHYIKPFFEMRAVYECGWNIFNRKGFSIEPQDISVNYSYIDHLSECGINWTNSENFEEAWKCASQYAHSLGIKLAKGVYGFSGGGPEHTMAEPNAPEHLLRESNIGPKTALCPFEEEACKWMKNNLHKRLQPDIDGIFIEPAREINRNCICDKCCNLLPYKWDVFVLNYLNDEILKINPAVEIVPYLFMSKYDDKKQWAQELQNLRKNIRHIFAWGMDDDTSLEDWLDSEPRFEHFSKLGRMQLFPEGLKPQTSVEKRVSSVFKWCRMAADRGKKGYMFDYRIFGGREWQGHGYNMPCTRVSNKLPASLAIAGEAMKNPYLDEKEQQEFINDLRARTDWDLDDPEQYYRGTN